jgi:hypothetical protein
MSTTQAQLLQFCRDYECETLSELLLSVAESSKHCTSEGGGRIPTWPLKEAARRLSELERENARLREAVADPVAVHLNMLRGGIAKPSINNIIHLYGADALRAALAGSGE